MCRTPDRRRLNLRFVEVLPCDRVGSHAAILAIPELALGEMPGATERHNIHPHHNDRRDQRERHSDMGLTPAIGIV
jgi:hypothetical protein